MRRSLMLVGLASSALGACAHYTPPKISYDDVPKPAVLAADPPKPVQIVQLPQPSELNASSDSFNSTSTRAPGDAPREAGECAGCLHSTPESAAALR